MELDDKFGDKVRVSVSVSFALGGRSGALTVCAAAGAGDRRSSTKHGQL
eukprot:SAG31_NODE_4364_length_3308_cov_1.969773_4_plen_49_part_00